MKTPSSLLNTSNSFQKSQLSFLKLTESVVAGFILLNTSYHTAKIKYHGVL